MIWMGRILQRDWSFDTVVLEPIGTAGTTQRVVPTRYLSLDDWGILSLALGTLDLQSVSTGLGVA